MTAPATTRRSATDTRQIPQTPQHLGRWLYLLGVPFEALTIWSAGQVIFASRDGLLDANDIKQLAVVAFAMSHHLRFGVILGIGIVGLAIGWFLEHRADNTDNLIALRLEKAAAEQPTLVPPPSRPEHNPPTVPVFVTVSPEPVSAPIDLSNDYLSDTVVIAAFTETEPPPSFVEAEVTSFSQSAPSIPDSRVAFEEALAAFNRSLETNPHNAVAWYNKGIAHANLNDQDSALVAFSQAVDLDPTLIPGWRGQGDAFLALGQPYEALIAYDHALTLDAQDAISQNGRGNALQGLGHYDDALAAYDQAIHSDPAYAIAWNNRGLALYAMGRYDDAASSYERAITLNPSFASAWNHRGLALRKLGHDQEALLAYDRSIALNPTATATWNNRAYTLMGIKQFGEALSAVNQALALDPSSAMAWCTKGEIFAAKEAYTDAIACFDRTLELDARLIAAWTAKAEALRALGLEDEALETDTRRQEFLGA